MAPLLHALLHVHSFISQIRPCRLSLCTVREQSREEVRPFSTAGPSDRWESIVCHRSCLAYRAPGLSEWEREKVLRRHLVFLKLCKLLNLLEVS